MKYLKSCEEFFDGDIIRHAVVLRVNGKKAYSYADLPADANRAQVANELWCLRKQVREFAHTHSVH